MILKMDDSYQNIFHIGYKIEVGDFRKLGYVTWTDLYSNESEYFEEIKRYWKSI